VLFGRHREQAEIAALLDAARASRSGVLVLRGEAGIGKTALLEDARERAADMHVLSARGVEAESELPFAGLHQLVRPALSHLNDLPAPQATALGAALGLSEGTGQERFLVFAACLTLLSELAEKQPVLCLVDDAHWLDQASADALGFVGRRLDAEGIVILFAARDDERASFDAPGLPSLELSGLDAEAAASVLAQGAGVDATASVRDSLVEQTRGNALALVELPSALSRNQLAGREPLPEVLPMTRQLEAVFLERARRLAPEAQRLLLVAAADDSEEVGFVMRAAALLSAGPADLDAAEQAGLVAVRGRRLEFRHPLVRSAVYEAATSRELRAAHAALASALVGQEAQADRRAWHLAASTLDPDEAVVHALDEAAARAEERNGHIAAAKALERAAELSLEPADCARRLVRAASNLSHAGRDDQAVAVAGRATPLVQDPMLRAELAHVQTLAAIHRGRPHDVVELLLQTAREVAATDAPKAIQLLVDAADAAWQGGDRAGYLETSDLAATVAPSAPDQVSTFFARSLDGFAAMIRGDTSRGAELLGGVAAAGAATEEPRHVLWASFAAQWLGDDERWAALVDRAAMLARARGELGILADTLGMRAAHLALDQRYSESSAAADEAVELARELRAANLELYPLAALAVVAAVEGRDEQAQRHAERALQLATQNGLQLRASAAVYALALVDMTRGRWVEALERFDSLAGGESGALDPMLVPFFPDKVETAVRAGRPAEAQRALEQYEARIAYSGAPSAQARLAACRALLTSGVEATKHFEAALELRNTRPFDLARMQLLFGEHLRRERRREEARLQLRAALDGFERLRAEPWAERARAELRASGETSRKRDTATIDQLTPQELQVARYVANGLSNKEVAAKLFLSPRTIDAHLRNVFAKLHITSRSQLARVQLAGDDPRFDAPRVATTA